MRHVEREIDFINVDRPAPAQTASTRVTSGGRNRQLVIVLVLLVAGSIGLWSVSGLVEGETDSSDESSAEDETTTDTSTVRSLPPALVNAEAFADEPTGGHLRQLFRSVGGFEGLELAVAEGDFDLVRFDPFNNNKLVASRRLSYGPAQNQNVNEKWELNAVGELNQTLWAPALVHDFAHYNVDGSTTMWTHGGGPGFAPRRATVIATDGTTITSEPIYASRFAAITGTVFALTGNGDYYTNDSGYYDLVADAGSGPVHLADGSRFSWIDTPTPGILVAYPAAVEGVTAVWDTHSLAPLPSHPLAGRSHQRSAISADGRRAVGATFDGHLEIIDLTTGLAAGTFGQVDVRGIDQPISLNEAGTIAVTVEKNGRVTMWWVGENEPVFSIAGSAGQPRWLSAEYSPLSASAVAHDSSRIALKTAALPDKPTTWVLLDTDVDSWISQARQSVGQSRND